MSQNERTIEGIWHEFLGECDRQLVSVHGTAQGGHGEAEQDAQRGFAWAEETLAGLEKAQHVRVGEAKERFESFTETVKFVQRDFLANVEEERSRQKEAEARIGELIEDMRRGVDVQLREEQGLGQKTHSDLLQLLETACAKIERSFMLN